MPQPLRVHVRMSFAERSDIYWIFNRRKRPSERDADVLRRMVIRYNQVLTNSASPDSEGVLALAQLLTREAFDLLFQPEYPNKHEICKVIGKAAIDQEVRLKLTRWVEEMTYGEYAKLIEAVENYYNGN